jgi:hypothetical protein
MDAAPFPGLRVIAGHDAHTINAEEKNESG